MKKFFLALIFYSFATISTVFAQDDVVNPCNSINYEPPRINFMTSYGKLEYDFSYDRQSLNEMGVSNGLVQPNMNVSGMTTAAIEWEVEVETTSKIADDYSICVVPTSLNIFIGIQNPKIYISGDISQDSCEFFLAVRHENQHQQINVLALEHYMPQIKKELSGKLASIKPRKADNLAQMDAITSKINDDYVVLISPLVDKFKASLFNAQKYLDTQKNYEYESTLCKIR